MICHYPPPSKHPTFFKIEKKIMFHFVFHSLLLYFFFRSCKNDHITHYFALKKLLIFFPYEVLDLFLGKKKFLLSFIKIKMSNKTRNLFKSTKGGIDKYADFLYTYKWVFEINVLKNYFPYLTVVFSFHSLKLLKNL